MTQAEKVIKYLAEKTNGLIVLNEATAKELIFLVEDHKLGRVKIMKYDQQGDNYYFYRQLLVEDDEIIDYAQKIQNTGEQTKCWAYEFWDSKGKLVVKVYSIHNNVF